MKTFVKVTNPSWVRSSPLYRRHAFDSFDNGLTPPVLGAIYQVLSRVVLESGHSGVFIVEKQGDGSRVYLIPSRYVEICLPIVEHRFAVTEDWDAVWEKGGRFVKVGCQKVEISKVLELAELIKQS